MLEVEIKLNPFGSGEHIHTLTTIYIANTGQSYGHGYMDYVYMIYEPESRFSSEVLLHGMIQDYDPMQPASKLLQAVMQDYGKGACELSQKYAERWIEERL